jgi:hypothetical protein
MFLNDETTRVVAVLLLFRKSPRSGLSSFAPLRCESNHDFDPTQFIPHCPLQTTCLLFSLEGLAAGPFNRRGA